MFFSQKLNSFKNLKHCFFSREKGISKGYYESLNCGVGSGDKKENVLKNLDLVAKKMTCKKKFLITLNQTHSNKVIHFKNERDIKNKLVGDAIVCEVKNIGISILTADCAPILFYDPKKNLVGCAHAGWKGALGGIIENTIKKFNELNSNNNDLIAVVGPCIDKKNYEVKENFFRKFINTNENNKDFFEKVSDRSYIFDLRGFVNKKILNLNIKNIEHIEMDTFSNKKYFYSYRRSTNNKERDYGRCISVILMT